MLTRCLKSLANSRLAFTFSSGAVRDQINYYDILDVETGATQQQIRRAYSDLTRNLTPEKDQTTFKQVNEAFVILTDNKTRQAYDSLLRVRKNFYLSPQEQRTPATRSYLAQRKQAKGEEIKKKLNIDEFGRYKGGLPQRYGTLRGSSLKQPGVLARQEQIEQQLDRYPEFNNVTASKAEGFKNFNQTDREAREIKWPWFTFQVNYDYFNFKSLRKAYWPKLQFVILLFYIIPSFYLAIDRFLKEVEVKKLKEKGAQKAASDAEKHGAEHSA